LNNRASYKEKTVEQCYEFLGCRQKNCIIQQQKNDKPCWEVEGTLCNYNGREILREKLACTKEEACNRSECIYYKAAKINGILGD